MLFLQPAVTKEQFVSGLAAAADAARDATYVTLDGQGRPTTDQAGIAFPGNDWIAFPNGDQYLGSLTNSTPQLLSELAMLRQKHLEAVSNLLYAIDHGGVRHYLNRGFKCP